MNWVDQLKAHLANDDKEAFQKSIDNVTKLALINRNDLTNAEIIRAILTINGVDCNISPDCDEYINKHPEPHTLLGFIIGHEVLHDFHSHKRKQGG